MCRKPCIVLLVLLLSVLCGCNNHDGQSTLDLLDEPRELTNAVSPERYTVSKDQTHIEILYPMFDLHEKNSAELNLLLKNAISDYLGTYGDGISTLTLSADYEITYADDKIISIVFRGESDVKGTAHPIQFAFAVNILVANPQIVKKTDFVNINDKLAQDIKTKAMLQDNSAIREYLGAFTADEIKRALWQEDVSFYLTDLGVGVIFPVPHSLGDYVDLRTTGDKGTVLLSPPMKAK